MESPWRRSSGSSVGFLLMISLIVAIAVFGLDLMTPLGVAGGVPYVAMVMLGLWHPRREYVLILAFTATLLTFSGYMLSPQGGIVWVVFTNRILAIFAIWVTALLIYMHGLTRAEHRKLARAVEQASVGIIITDHEGVTEYANPKMLEMSGCELSEIKGNIPQVFKSNQMSPEIYQELWKTINAGEVWQGELANRSKDGHLSWENVSISPVFDTTCDVTNFVVIKKDVTKCKTVRKELDTARQKAEIANRTKSSFLASMSHELRTPLNAIIGFSEIMKMQVMGPMENDKYTTYSHHIHDSAVHLLNVINDVLDLSRIEAGKETLHEEIINTEDFLNTCLPLLENIATENSVRLENPDRCEIAYIKGDEQKLRQVLINLLSNAIKFTPAGSVVSVQTFMADEGDGVIEVSDTGIGISRENQEKAFEKFEQIDNEMSGFVKGSGLGLPLSLHLMEMHGGTLELESTPGKGTKVRMIFPAWCMVNS